MGAAWNGCRFNLVVVVVVMQICEGSVTAANAWVLGSNNRAGCYRVVGRRAGLR